MSTVAELIKQLKADGVIVPSKPSVETVRALKSNLDRFLALTHEKLKAIAAEHGCVAPRNKKLPMAVELVNKGVSPPDLATPAPKAAAPKAATPTPKTPTPTAKAAAEVIVYLLELKIDALKALVIELKLEAKKNLKQSMIDALIATGLTAKQLAAVAASAAAKTASAAAKAASAAAKAK